MMDPNRELIPRSAPVDPLSPTAQDPNLPIDSDRRSSLRTELADLESQLSQRELELATLHAEIQSFEREYEGLIGTRRRILEQIEAQIQQYLLYLEAKPSFQPSPELKQLYRDVAKRIHPDLALDEEERARRQHVMAEVNQAYAAGDLEYLRAVLADCETRANDDSESYYAETLRITRKIAQIRQRLGSIREEFMTLAGTDLYQMQQRVQASRRAGGDLLLDMAGLIDEEIALAVQKLEMLKSQVQ